MTHFHFFKSLFDSTHLPDVVIVDFITLCLLVLFFFYQHYQCDPCGWDVDFPVSSMKEDKRIITSVSQ